jgi:hypothetical protein
MHVIDLSDCPQLIQDEERAIARIAEALGMIHGKVKPARETAIDGEFGQSENVQDCRPVRGEDPDGVEAASRGDHQVQGYAEDQPDPR